MNTFGSKSWRRRPKNKGKWPKWLRNSYLLRMAIFIGVLAYRLWRIWQTLVDMFGS